jgi:hypothetical protein
MDDSRSPAAGPADPARRIGPIKKLVFGLVLVALPLALVEVGVRVLLGEPDDSPLLVPAEETGGAETPRWKTSELHEIDPDLIWRNRAGIDIEYKGVRVRTNRHGMRGEEFPTRKPAGEYRILSLGESTTFGSKVEQEETYSAVLERCLNERRTDRSYRVLNAGTPGWTLAQSWKYLRDEGIGFEPDAILLYHGFNDFLPTAMTERRTGEGAEGGTDLELLEERQGAVASIGSWLARHSMALRWLAWRVKSRGPAGGDALEAGATQATASVRVPERDRLELLRRIRDLASAGNARLVVLVPCYRDFTDHRALLLDFTERNRVDRIDLEEVISSIGGIRSDLFADGAHPKARVHAAFGEAICAYFDSRILPREGEGVGREPR